MNGFAPWLGSITMGAQAMSTTSRRAILAGAATLPALSLPAIAKAAEPDPIFDLIERHRAAYEAHGRAIEAADEYDWLADERVGAACDADCDALRTLVLTVPTTFAGAAAMLRYLIEFTEMGNNPLGICMSDDPDDHSCTEDAFLGTMVKFMEARA